MLDYEYLQCDLTLRKQRGADTAFFAFSDTVVAKAFNRDNECHGWLGIKYQSAPKCVLRPWLWPCSSKGPCSIHPTGMTSTCL